LEGASVCSLREGAAEKGQCEQHQQDGNVPKKELFLKTRHTKTSKGTTIYGGAGLELDVCS